MPAPKTKLMTAGMAALGIDLESEHALLIVSDLFPNLKLAARNLDKLKVNTIDALNAYDILRADKIVIEQSALRYIQVRCPFTCGCAMIMMLLVIACWVCFWSHGIYKVMGGDPLTSRTSERGSRAAGCCVAQGSLEGRLLRCTSFLSQQAAVLHEAGGCL